MHWEAIAEARRRVANEEGAILKDWGGRLPIALCYPNTYYLGMSNLGFQTIYALFNGYKDVVCERVFKDEHLISLESQRELNEFAVVAFSLSFEMDYFNLLSMLRGAQIPLWAEERDETHPLLIAGGPCVTANPEPIALFFDALVIGEGEMVIPALVEKLWEGLAGERERLLRELATVPGIYVPRFYDPEYEIGGGITAVTAAQGLPLPVERQWVRDLDGFPTTSVVLTEDTEFGDMYLAEMGRGCGRGCHFCLVGQIYSPLRFRSLESLLGGVREGLSYRERIGLVGAAVSDYPWIDEFTRESLQMGARLSSSSLCLDSLSETLAWALAESGVQTITFAPEAGSERLRKLIGKGFSHEAILRAIGLAQRYGFGQLKLYFMIGLPSETEEDIGAITDLCQEIRGIFPRHLTAKITPFVPKAQTPFERVKMAPASVLEERLGSLRRGLFPLGIEVRAESPSWSTVQGVLARGNRRVAGGLAAVEEVSLSAWREALASCGLKAEFYLERKRPSGELPPWSTVAALRQIPHRAKL